MNSHHQALRVLIDSIMSTDTNPNAVVISRLRQMRNSLSLEEPMPRYDVETLDEAIAALGGHK